jgi:hypothetical protein
VSGVKSPPKSAAVTGADVTLTGVSAASAPAGNSSLNPEASMVPPDAPMVWLARALAAPRVR